MALTPIQFAVSDLDAGQQSSNEVIQPSKTWEMDLQNGRMKRLIDGESAVRQYIRKALSTARNRFLIYDGEYGEELTDLIGQDLSPNLAQVEIPRLVREALIFDDRIAGVPSVVVNQHQKDGIHIKVIVELVDGQLLTEEVIKWR